MIVTNVSSHTIWEVLLVFFLFLRDLVVECNLRYYFFLFSFIVPIKAVCSFLFSSITPSRLYNHLRCEGFYAILLLSVTHDIVFQNTKSPSRGLGNMTHDVLAVLCAIVALLLSPYMFSSCTVCKLCSE